MDTFDGTTQWIITVVMVVLAIICGYFAKETLKRIDKILERLNSISEIVAKQEVRNEDNDDEHAEIKTTLKEHGEKILGIDKRVSTIETEHKHNHKD